MNEGFETLKSVAADLRMINESFSLPDSRESSQMMLSAVFISELICSSCAGYEVFRKKCETVVFNTDREILSDSLAVKLINIKQKSDRLMEKCLKVVEHFVKKDMEEIENTSKDVTTTENDADNASYDLGRY